MTDAPGVHLSLAAGDWRRSYEASRLRPWLIWSFILVAWLYPSFLFPIHNPNERVRLYMTASMVEFGTFTIGDRTRQFDEEPQHQWAYRDSGFLHDRWGYVNDRALSCDDPSRTPPNCTGRLFSAKAPGTSFLGVVPYAVLHGMAVWMGRDLSMESILWFLRFVVVVIPSLLMLWGFRRLGRRHQVDPVLLDLMTVGLAVGSMVFTYGHMFAGHQICAWLLFFSFLAAEGSARDARWVLPFLSGLAGGMAVTTEYPMVAVFLVIFVFQWVIRPRFSTLIWFGLGALGPAMLAAWYHTVAFGRPWRTAYSTLENPQFVKDIDYGFMGLRAPRWENLWESFFGPTLGMFYYSPWSALVVVFPFLSPLVRRQGRGGASLSVRRLLWVSAAALCMLTLFISCHSLWRSGWTIGPRYIVPFAPFAALVVLFSADRLALASPVLVRSVVAVTVLASVLITGLSSLVSQGFSFAFFNPIREVLLPLLRDGFVTLNPGHYLGLEGAWSLWPVWLTGGACLWWILWWLPGERKTPLSVRMLLLAVVGVMSLGAFHAAALPGKPESLQRLQARAFARNHFYPGNYRNRYLKIRHLESEALKQYPAHPDLLRLAMQQATLEGDCARSGRLALKWSTGDVERTTGVVLVTAFQMLSPVPQPLFPVTPGVAAVQRSFSVAASAESTGTESQE